MPEGEYVVQKIVGKRFKNGNQIQYKVKWKGYDSKQNTWQPVKHLKNVNEMIKDFEERNKQNLKQLSSKLRQSNQIKASSLPKKGFKKDNLKKLLKASKLDKEQQAQRERQSLRIIRRQRKEEDKSPQKSQPFNKKVSDTEVKEILPSNQSVQEDQVTQSFEVLAEEIDWDSIANKIINVTKQKQKYKQSYSVIGIVKTRPGQADRYLVQDSFGQLSQQTREYVLKNLSLELIAFYQKQMSPNL